LIKRVIGISEVLFQKKRLFGGENKTFSDIIGNGVDNTIGGCYNIVVFTD